jgi:hypothetical protein
VFVEETDPKTARSGESVNLSATCGSRAAGEASGAPDETGIALE